MLPVNSRVDSVVEDNYSTVWLSPSRSLVSRHDAAPTIVAIFFSRSVMIPVIRVKNDSFLSVSTVCSVCHSHK